MPLTEPTRLVLRKGWQPMDADAAAYISAVETADGQALEEKTKIAIDNFVIGCKADGIWTAIKASCILAGARTLDGALVPLVGTAPTNFNFVAGDYNRKTGLIGDANTKYLDSNRNNNADPQNNQHLSVYVGALRTTASRFYIASDYSVTGASSLSDAGSRSRQTTPESINYNYLGLVGLSRSNGADYLNRVDHITSTITRTSAAPGSSNIHVFGSSRTAGPLRTDARIAFYSIGEALDLALLDARVTDLINAFGAAIP